ncbi:MAG: hypothetical protein CUN55_10385 [Phototrophicales bacterium]|nr:MAG: hypothetical protein CUN55_10385 [Phototrophicales bacterium]
MKDKQHTAWHVIEQTTLTDASPWLKVIQEHIQLPNGVEIPDYFRILMPDYVMIFALTPEQQVVTVSHYKHGPQVVSLELPAGYIDPNDSDPLATAKRELQEETGMVSNTWRILGRFFIDGNRGCGWMHGFLAQNATLQHSQTLEKTELLTMQLIPLNELKALWLEGKVQNVAASALIGMALARLNY